MASRGLTSRLVRRAALDLVRPVDDRVGPVLPVAAGEGRVEVAVATGRALVDLVQLGLQLLCSLATRPHLLEHGRGIGQVAEEHLEQERISRGVGWRRRRLDPVPERVAAAARDAVDLLVGALLLGDLAAGRIAGLDEPRENHPDLALGRVPEVADARLRVLLHVVPRLGPPVRSPRTATSVAVSSAVLVLTGIVLSGLYRQVSARVGRGRPGERAPPPRRRARRPRR